MSRRGRGAKAPVPSAQGARLTRTTSIAELFSSPKATGKPVKRPPPSTSPSDGKQPSKLLKESLCSDPPPEEKGVEQKLPHDGDSTAATDAEY